MVTYSVNWTRISEIEKVFNDVKENFKEIHVLINNVALSLAFGSTLSTTESQYDKMMDGNIKSHFFATKMFVEIMPKGQNCSVIFISSFLGKCPQGMMGIYSLTKTALMSLTLILSRELEKKQIRVNCI